MAVGLPERKHAGDDLSGRTARLVLQVPAVARAAAQLLCNAALQHGTTWHVALQHSTRHGVVWCGVVYGVWHHKLGRKPVTRLASSRMCACVCVCVCVCVRARVCVCVRGYACMCVCVGWRASCVCVRSPACVRALARVCVRARGVLLQPAVHSRARRPDLHRHAQPPPSPSLVPYEDKH